MPIYGARSIFAMDPNGTAVASAFLVNTTTAATQQNPSVAGDPNGHAVIIWTGTGIGDLDCRVVRKRCLQATTQRVISISCP